MEGRDLMYLIIFSIVLGGLGFALGHWLWQPSAEIAFAVGAFSGGILGGLFALWGTEWEEEALLEEAKNAKQAKMRSVYVGNIPFDAKEEEIKQIFSPVGTVYRVRIGRDPKTKRAKGYAFVDMDAEGAERALSELKNVRLRGRLLKIGRAVRDPRP